jgi:hypothetical protein
MLNFVLRYQVSGRVKVTANVGDRVTVRIRDNQTRTLSLTVTLTHVEFRNLISGAERGALLARADALLYTPDRLGPRLGLGLG